MKCALVGNQNSGKSLLFNNLTGLNQKVGNWAGVTVDFKEGFIKKTGIEIVDLPGIYSLFPYSNEEEVTRDYLINEDISLIINVVDSTSLERSLYLTTQLLQLGIDTILLLNMNDILKKRGFVIDIEKLSEKLGVTVLPISALKKTGINTLIDTIKKQNYKKHTNIDIFNEDISNFIKKYSNLFFLESAHKNFSACELLERSNYSKEYLNDEIEEEIKQIELKYNDDIEELIVNERYNFVENLKKETLQESKIKSTTEKIDKIVLNKWAAIPIFILIISLVFTLSVGIFGGLTVNLMDAFFNGADGEIPIEIFGLGIASISSNFIGVGPYFSELILSSGGSNWASSLVRDGMIAGVGAVLNFVPQLIILYLLLGLLETSGYMSRITFLFDNLFRRIGLTGKSLVSFIVGAGCSVPAIMSCRTIENDVERKKTIMLTPFIPCNAKLPIIATISGSFFGSYALLVTLSMYFSSILIIILAAFIINKFFKRTNQSSFINELPNYNIPSISYIAKDSLFKTWDFVERAGTIILLSSIIIWFLTSFSYDFHFIDLEADASLQAVKYTIDDSLLAYIGKGVSWIFYPMIGIGHSYNDIWGASVSAIQGIVAKEQVISSMQVIAKVADSSNIFESSMFSFFNPITAFAYMTFNLFSIPCLGAVGALKKELGSNKYFYFTLALEFFLAWGISTAIGIVGGLCTIGGVF